MKKNNHKAFKNTVALRIFICIVTASITLYAYIDKQNDLTELRLAIPTLAKEVKAINEENIRLRYEIERFESPIHLMELMRNPEYSHLKFPYLSEEIFLPKAKVPLQNENSSSIPDFPRTFIK